MKCPSCLSIGPKLHCEAIGAGPEPLLFLHGFAASSVTWEEISPYFPLDRFRLYLLDLKGSGKSDKPRDNAYSPEDQANLVLNAIEGLGIRNITMIGHSLGGGIALLAWHKGKATCRSALISRLVLIDAAAYPQRFPRFFQWLRKPILGWLLLRLLPLRSMVRYNLRHVYHDPEQVTEARVARYMGCFRGAGTVAAIIATARQVDSLRSIPDHGQIDVPTLIIWGRYDRVIRLQSGERLHAEIPGSRLVVMDCGHNPHEEEAAASAAAIIGFIN
ncbi:putative hydrolase YugF [Geobacter sp. OR-1]|uniref:alpha/beta fold hydrolase n=1 Tax=Geobacter sp. OR-1 TaxID=1266765 RepID=UPI000541DAD7|nr:alpha/beta hydrolase [Geobacter sp. OR-1]GAM09562.1 putative hydrolase YugF [Geobacter sp. OR-1]